MRSRVLAVANWTVTAALLGAAAVGTYTTMPVSEGALLGPAPRVSWSLPDCGIQEGTFPCIADGDDQTAFRADADGTTEVTFPIATLEDGSDCHVDLCVWYSESTGRWYSVPE